jgi:hypothetical protein
MQGMVDIIKRYPARGSVGGGQRRGGLEDQQGEPGSFILWSSGLKNKGFASEL